MLFLNTVSVQFNTVFPALNMKPAAEKSLSELLEISEHDAILHHCLQI